MRGEYVVKRQVDNSYLVRQRDRRRRRAVLDQVVAVGRALHLVQRDAIAQHGEPFDLATVILAPDDDPRPAWWGPVTEIDSSGCGWVDLDISVSVGDRVCTTCAARVALPVDDNDNPWSRRADSWTP